MIQTPTRNMVLKWARKTKIMSRSTFYTMMFPSYFNDLMHKPDMETEAYEYAFSDAYDILEKEIVEYRIGEGQIENEKFSKDNIVAYCMNKL